MKTMKFLAGLMAGVLMLSGSTVSMPVNANKAARQEYELNGLDPNDSPVKPTLSLSRLEVPLNVAKAEPVQKIELFV